MEPVVIVAGLMLLALVLYLVGAPLLSREDEPDVDDYGVDQEEKRDAKDTLFTTLAEIEFDYQMGKMNEDDYLELKQAYQPQAVAALQKEEKAVTQGQGRATQQAIERELAEELEQELAEIRRRARKEG